MKNPCQRPFWFRLCDAALIGFMLLCVSGCATIDTEYAQKLAAARTDCLGNEVVGIWVSKVAYRRHTLLIRPDGTGVMRVILERASWGTQEWLLNVNYAGAGLWRGTANANGHKAKGGAGFTIHHTGNELLFHFGIFKMVFVRSNDDAAVENHLRQREGR